MADLTIGVLNCPFCSCQEVENSGSSDELALDGHAPIAEFHCEECDRSFYVSHEVLEAICATETDDDCGLEPDELVEVGDEEEEK